MSRPGSPETEIQDEDEDPWTYDENTWPPSPVTPPPTGGTDSLRLVSHIEKGRWKPGQVCADIRVYPKDTDQKQVLILDQHGQDYTRQPKAEAKYVFVFADATIQFYTTREELSSAIATHIGLSDKTGIGGFILSDVIEVLRAAEPPTCIPDDELRELNQTLEAVSVRYCKMLTTPGYALTLQNDSFVRRQLSICGLYLRTLSLNQKAMCFKARVWDSDSVFPVFGKLGPVKINEGYIQVVVIQVVMVCDDQGRKVLKDQDHKVLVITQDIDELNREGCFFLVEGDVPAGKIEPVPDGYGEVASIIQ